MGDRLRNEVREWPIILGGGHRTGTTLLRYLLDGHSRIHCGAEVKFFRDFHDHYLKGDPLKHLRFSQSARSLLPEDELLDVLGGAFVEVHARAAKRAGKQRWADKDPDNSLYLGGWERLLGSQWVYVHTVRDPVDTLASMREAGFKLSLPDDLDGQIQIYRQAMTAGLDFVARHPERACWIRYEDLARSTEPILRGLMNWIGEFFEAGQLEFSAQRKTEGLGDPKIRATEGAHGDSVGRGERVLSAEEVARVRGATAPILKSLAPVAASWMKP
jgi:hypothetical protein